MAAEVESGLNGHRKGLIRRLRSCEYKKIMVWHLDHLAQFGTEGIAAALAAQGRGQVVGDPEEVKDDLMQNTIDARTGRRENHWGEYETGEPGKT